MVTTQTLTDPKVRSLKLTAMAKRRRKTSLSPSPTQHRHRLISRGGKFGPTAPGLAHRIRLRMVFSTSFHPARYLPRVRPCSSSTKSAARRLIGHKKPPKAVLNPQPEAQAPDTPPRAGKGRRAGRHTQSGAPFYRPQRNDEDCRDFPLARNVIHVLIRRETDRTACG